MSSRVRVLALVVCVFLMALSITWLIAATRTAMDVGASCADGGPYVIVAPCPEHTTALTLIGMFLSFVTALAGTAAALTVGAPNMVVPYWTFTLGSLSVLFIVYGVTRADDLVWGWVLGGLVGVVMALPGLYLMSPWQRVYRRQRLPDAPLSRGAWWLVYLGLAAVGVIVGAWTADGWL